MITVGLTSELSPAEVAEKLTKEDLTLVSLKVQNCIVDEGLDLPEAQLAFRLFEIFGNIFGWRSVQECEGGSHFGSCANDHHRCGNSFGYRCDPKGGLRPREIFFSKSARRLEPLEAIRAAMTKLLEMIRL